MPNHITDTTQLQCDKGTILSLITVTSQTFMTIEGKLQATEEDKQSNTNIKNLRAMQTEAFFRRIFILYSCSCTMAGHFRF